MNSKLSLTTVRRTHSSPLQRRQVLAELARSGLSRAMFARQRGIAYSTLCAWRKRQAMEAQVSFAEVELEEGPAAGSLVVELGRQARMHLTSQAQLRLAARLLKELEAVC